jgi:electron transfer flavoprotein alpha subunit
MTDTTAEEKRIDPSLPTIETPSNKEVMVFCEQVDGQLQPVALELLGAGRHLANKLGGKLSGIVFGRHISHLPQQIIHHGADQVYAADHEELATYRTLPYRRVLLDMLTPMDPPPHILLMGSTTTGRDLAPRIASRLNTGLTADCVELDIGPYEHTNKADPDKLGYYPGCLYAIRPSFGESLKARILGPWHNPQMATARPGVMIPLPKDENRQGEVFWLIPHFSPEDLRLSVTEVVREVNQTLSLTDAEVIIAGGYGMGGADGFNLLRQLADCFDNAVIGASRKAVDVGWIPYANQVGQTGKTVRPKLYIACGISGALQHRVGMSKSDVIIAINKDPDAPIFNFAHHGIVGDLYQVIPAMIEQLKVHRDARAMAVTP